MISWLCPYIKLRFLDIQFQGYILVIITFISFRYHFLQSMKSLNYINALQQANSLIYKGKSQNLYKKKVNYFTYRKLSWTKPGWVFKSITYILLINLSKKQVAILIQQKKFAIPTKSPKNISLKPNKRTNTNIGSHICSQTLGICKTQVLIHMQIQTY